MSGTIKRCVFTYDTEYDKDIEKLLLSVPPGRRSERIRQLLRLGAEAEAQKHGVSPIVASSEAPNTEPKEDTKPKRKMPGFIEPPT